jgi:hypothetical protein
MQSHQDDYCPISQALNALLRQDRKQPLKRFNKPIGSRGRKPETDALFRVGSLLFSLYQVFDAPVNDATPSGVVDEGSNG